MGDGDSPNAKWYLGKRCLQQISCKSLRVLWDIAPTSASCSLHVPKKCRNDLCCFLCFSGVRFRVLVCRMTWRVPPVWSKEAGFSFVRRTASQGRGPGSPLPGVKSQPRPGSKGKRQPAALALDWHCEGLGCAEQGRERPWHPLHAKWSRSNYPGLGLTAGKEALPVSARVPRNPAKATPTGKVTSL